MSATFDDKPLGRVVRGDTDWKDWDADELREHVQQMIATARRNHDARGLLVRMHPQTWRDIGLRVSTGDVPIVCNTGHGEESVSVSNERHQRDVNCPTR